MTRIGKAGFSLCLSLLLLLLPAATQAALEASVDRQQVALGDTVRLEITATGDEELNAIELEPLLDDFQVLQRSTRSSVQIVNGERSHTRRLLIDLLPRREGELRIPSLRAGRARSPALTVSVTEAAQAPAEDAQVLFEAELDRDSVYVQGQLILTLRIQQAIQLEARSVTDLTIEDAFIKPLEQQSYQRTVNGRPWLVHELRYAIFPEHSGTLEIPAQTFSGRESRAQRSLFDRNSGRTVRRSTRPLQVEVMPRPDAFPDGATWLPASELSVEEHWSTPPDELRAGESATRTITLTGTGLQGAQLPPILFRAQAGLKAYPDQPEISEREVSSGLVGVRSDSAALVPTAPGEYRIPAIRIPWWDTESDSLREALIPARTVRVAPAPANAASASAAPGPATSTPAHAQPAVAGPDTNAWLWRAAAVISSIGWLVTLLLLLRRPRSASPSEPSREAPEPASEREAFKQLLAACASDQPARARQALLHWARVCYQLPTSPDSATLRRHAASDALSTALDELDAHLYGSGSGGSWHGERLAAIARELRRQQGRGKSAGATAQDPLALYPGQA